MEYTIQAGTTSKRIPVLIQDAAAGDGAGLTGLVFNSSGLVGYYWREDQGNAGATAITLATMTRGTWATGGFVEKDSANQPGMYELGIPDAALATGAGWVIIMLKGAAGMVPRTIVIQLTPPPALAKNTAITGFQFPLSDSGGVPVTGATVTAQRSIDGAALGACTNAVTELSNGWYKITLSAADLNGSVIALRFSATGAIDQNYTLTMQPTVP